MSRDGDDAERSDAEERRTMSDGDDAERSDAEERRTMSDGDDAEQGSDVGAPPARGGEERRQ